MTEKEKLQKIKEILEKFENSYLSGSALYYDIKEVLEK